MKTRIMRIMRITRMKREHELYEWISKIRVPVRVIRVPYSCNPCLKINDDFHLPQPV